MKSRKIFLNEYVQNCTNWCWAVACRMVGEQFKRNNPSFNFQIPHEERLYIDEEMRMVHNQDIIFYYCTGVRTDVVWQENGLYLLDSAQRFIVKNANTIYPGCDGNWPGDDEAKERGLKYVVTGKCDSDLIQIVNLGYFDSEDSLLVHNVEQIRNVFAHNDYMIGNAVLYPKGICHSFVLLDWTEEDEILIYDPWDGTFAFLSVADVFCHGISSSLERYADIGITLHLR